MRSANRAPVYRNRKSYIAPFTIVLLTLLLLGIFSVRFIYYIKSPNINLGAKRYTYLYIPTGTKFDGLLKILDDRSILKNRKSFIFIASRKHYLNKVKAGKYRIVNGMNNNELVNILRSGLQEPVMLSFQNARTSAELAGKLGRQIEADSASLMKLFIDPRFLMKFGTNPENVFDLFIPNTYEMFWNTSATQLFLKMKLEQEAFWSKSRRMRLDSIGMNIQQVVTIASIIEKESNRNSEKPDIAGVYMNRLRKGWALQADPTIIYALQDYTIRRLNSEQLRTASRYNTYIHTGLPPGPICIPSISSIDAVLHYRHHGFMYFCARDDFSGYHNFAVSLAEHQQNARKYQKALDQLNIK